jgi:Putative transposase
MEGQRAKPRWLGSAMTHHPHIHMIVPGGGLSADGTRWIASRPGFFLPVRVLSRLFRRLFLSQLATAHAEGRLAFFGALETLAVPRAFAAFVKRQRRVEWVTYAKAPFAGPKQVLAYLARYTHRIAISNRRLIRADADGVTFTYKDYRVEGSGRFKTMTLATHEFIRRFLIAKCRPRASTASVITDCSPTATAKPWSRRPASCWP